VKNFLMIACVAVCTVFMAGNTSYAIGGGSGGGGGKVASSARVVITNTSPVGGTAVAAWVITTVNVLDIINIPDNTPIDQAAVNQAMIDSETFVINGVDRTVNVNGATIGFVN